VSASVLAVPDAGPGGAALLYAGGPPCTAPWEDLSPLLRGLAP